MLFNSLPFLFFLPVAFVLYWASPAKVRYITLLIISLFYYLTFGPKYILLLLCTIFVTWMAAIKVYDVRDRDDGKRSRAKLILAGACACCLGLLFFFKYFNFMSMTVTRVLNLFSLNLHPFTLKLMLPVGISFYTFMTVSYLADVYLGKIEPERNFAKYALYVSFFPHIVMGPIGRADKLMPQLFPEDPGVRHFDETEASIGLRMMLWGFFKKLIIADSLGKYVDLIYENVPYYFGLTFIMVAVMYSFQIYCDFSGYTDIATGTARLFNINLGPNFRSPYFATSIRDFWSRWHISLSTWLRDYVYIPLGGSRCSEAKRNRNLMATFLVSGLWHGASWTFVFWGALHGIYQIGERMIGKSIGKKNRDAFGGESGGETGDAPGGEGGKKASTVLLRIVKTLVTFGLVTIAWIFFRADTFKDAVFIVTHLHSGVIRHLPESWEKMMSDLMITELGLFKLFGSLIALGIYDFISLKRDIPVAMAKLPLIVRWGIYSALTVLIIVSKLHGGTTQSFIYFNF